jgi:hypothetical protein
MALVDRTEPAYGRGASWRAVRVCVLLSVTVALVLPPAIAAGEGGPADPGDPPAPTAWVYLPIISTPRSAPPPPGALHVYLPLLASRAAIGTACPSGSTAQWAEVSPTRSLIAGAAASPDLNMNVRGWVSVEEFLGFVQYSYPPDSPPDTVHPLLLSNIAGSTEGSFVRTYQVNDWDWLGCNCAKPRNPSPYPVTMLGLRTAPGQALRIASRSLPINSQGHTAMVLYADATQIALKYTREDRVDEGYLVHLVNLCVDPNLVALYQRLDAAGRKKLPAVSNLSIIGTGLGDEVDVIVRDSGAFLDPRSRQDWWQDQPLPAGWSR